MLRHPETGSAAIAAMAWANIPHRRCSIPATGSFGYYHDLEPGGELVQLFDIEKDPEELNDLSTVKKDIAQDLLKELKSKLTEMNEPYL